jgi:hypothetical protein
MDRRSPIRPRGGLLALVCLAAGCSCSGDRRAVVRGTVSLDGVPLPYGVVQFHGSAGRVVTAALRSDGTFTATDLPPGEVRVAVVEDIMTTPKGKNRVQIPAKYKDARTSGLGYTVTPATRNLDIALTSK